MVILLTQHDDGSLTSRRWTVTATRAGVIGVDLGEPDYVAFTPASAVREFAPQATGAAVVLAREKP